VSKSACRRIKEAAAKDGHSEYGMLPRSTNERMGREASKGKQSGRTRKFSG